MNFQGIALVLLAISVEGSQLSASAATSELSVAKSSFAGMLVYLGEVNDPANKLFGELQELITRMEEPKSRVAKVLLDQSIGKIISKD